MNDWNEDEFLDEDELAEKAKRYHSDYLSAMGDFTKNLEDSDRESILETMESIKYRPTNDAAQDAELNYLRSRKLVAGKKRKLGGAAGGAVSSFLKSKARSEGKSQASIEAWANKTMRED